MLVGLGRRYLYVRYDPRGCGLSDRRAAVAADLDPGPTAYADYAATRDRLTLPILTLGDEVAAMNWGEERISTLLRELNVAME